jgi:hypothetical protein
MKKNILLLVAFCSACCLAHAQDTLPNFSVKNIGNNRIVISWVNNYQLVKQISIQRSVDSLRNYRTILTVPDPMNKSNGYVDVKAPNDQSFYRLFIVLNGAMFVFSPVKKPLLDTAKNELTATERKKLDPFSLEVNRPIITMDSTLKKNSFDPKNKPDIFIPSNFIYTSSDGNVHLNLPGASEKKYSIKFYEENFIFLFEIKNIKETSLILDKTVFYHSGWFNFELYEDDKLKEKHKFYLKKEF